MNSIITTTNEARAKVEDYRSIIKSFRTFNQLMKAVSEYCERTGRACIGADIMRSTYESQKRGDYMLSCAITRDSVIFLREKGMYAYPRLDDMGKRERALLLVMHSASPLFGKGYSVCIFSRHHRIAV